MLWKMRWFFARQSIYTLTILTRFDSSINQEVDLSNLKEVINTVESVCIVRICTQRVVHES